MKLYIALLASALATTKADYDRIAGYMPGTQVGDHSAIDLDQAAIETELKLAIPNFDQAKEIYNEGGHSKSYALLNFHGIRPRSISKGDILSGTADNGRAVSGKAADDYVYQSDVIEIKLYYIVTDERDRCQVGALALVDVNTSGCFQEEGVLTTAEDGEVGSYTYTPMDHNRNDRTIAGFSKQAGTKMADMVDFEYFQAYYGKADYGDHWVTSAFNGTTTEFARGNADFSRYGNIGKVQAIKKGTAYLNVFMYVIREFEDALDDCVTNGENNNPAVHAWDEGVAFYTGSLEGTVTGGDSGAGKLLHQLADKRCRNFNTCISDGGPLEGTSKINKELFELFDAGKNYLSNGDCHNATEIVPRITAKMYVPMVQGTLRYTYKVAMLDGGEKEEAEGAIFAAAVLPKVHNFSPDAATAIYAKMNDAATRTSLAAVEEVKASFESVYADMGISCADVGGLVDGDNYYSGMEPCDDPVVQMETGVWSEKFESVSKVLRGANAVIMG